MLLSAQLQQYTGDYESKYESDKGDGFRYSLNLSPDGTYLFHAYSNIQCAICTEKNEYGEGNWNAMDKIISFTASPAVPADENHPLNLHNSRARMNLRSPRNLSSKPFRESLKFFYSDISWVKGMELTKIPLAKQQ